MRFEKWLKLQVDRDDRVGDIARDAQADSRQKPSQNTLEAWETFLSSAQACWEAMESLREAWEEYSE